MVLDEAAMSSGIQIGNAHAFKCIL